MISVDLRVPAPPHVRATAGPRRATPPPQGIHATTPLNDGKDPALEQKQAVRIHELESHLDKDPGSLENEYFNKIGDELREQKRLRPDEADDDDAPR